MNLQHQNPTVYSIDNQQIFEWHNFAIPEIQYATKEPMNKMAEIIQLTRTEPINENEGVFYGRNNYHIISYILLNSFSIENE